MSGRGARWAALVFAGALGAAVAHAEPSFFTARVAPILDRHCVVCHGPEKQKAGLRVDSLELLMRGAESGAVVKAGNVKESEFFRRVTLPHDHEDVMPSDGKPLLTPDEIKTLRLWIEAGASGTAVVSAFPDAPALKPRKIETVALAPDWRPMREQMRAWEKQTGLRLVPRSQVPTDGLVLRTASAPGRCDDAALARLGALGALIVEAELARTKVSDAGLAAVTAWTNLRGLDLTRTKVTSAGVATLVKLEKLEELNLTQTAVDDTAVAALKRLPELKRIWLFGTQATQPAEDLPEKVVAK